MANLHKLSECTDMTREQFEECLSQIDWGPVIDNPTQALINAGITLKPGITFKFVETDQEADALPTNVFPLKRIQKNDRPLSMENLDKVAGGRWVTDRPAALGGTGMSRWIPD